MSEGPVWAEGNHDHPHEDFVQCGGGDWWCVERDARIQGGECGEQWCEVC